MKTVYRFFVRSKIRLGHVLSLIFFVLFAVACKQDSGEEIRIVWQDEQASGIVIPMHLLEESDSAKQLLAVRLENNTSDMLGNYRMQDDEVLFEPLVPLTRGLKYEIHFRRKLIGKIAVPQADADQAPRLVAVYPSADSLPANLLKIYLQFSAPMQEGAAMHNVALLNERGDTLSHVFLNQELWNKERTVVTLWLDPGRIKRDLIPNQEMGNPLQKGSRYELSLSSQWKSIQGLPLQQSYSKKFFVGERDDTSPQPHLWQTNMVQAGSKKALQVQLDEPLDYFLLQETIIILDEEGKKMAGNINISDKEKTIEFVPANMWQQGRYRLRIASHLEDLAGNNLVRSFDRDITKQGAKEEIEIVEKEFTVGR